MNATGKFRRGTVLVYTMVAMVGLLSICSLAVDWGRVQYVKTEMRAASDAAARGGAQGLATGPAGARAMAKWVAQQNQANGEIVDTTKERVELGSWDTATRQFTLLSGFGELNANAVRVVVRRAADRGDAVPLSFASFTGRQSQDILTESIAMRVPPVNVNQGVLATANPFLSGMPAGTVASLNNPHNSPDYAGDATNVRQSPQPVPVPFAEGQSLTFDSIDGTARHDPNLAYFDPDGQVNDIGHNTAGSEHGIADTNAPINALVGIFLSDAAPDATATPAKLDFSSAASRDFQVLKPQLKQIFFIGDGLDSHGVQQQFVAPPGATRLFLATWDFYEWNNNFGSRTVKVSRPEQIILVK